MGSEDPVIKLILFQIAYKRSLTHFYFHFSSGREGCFDGGFHVFSPF
jgi:hypothetical protein